MTVSYNWLKQYLDLELPAERVAELLTAIGLEVEGVEQVDSIKGGLRGVVVGHVLECQRHPNADKLSVTRVDIGTGEPLPIVCGAPNVAAGQKVLVATVGTTLYAADGEAFEIKKAKVRGEASHGMICAEDELGLGHSHEGIMVLPAEVPVGTLAAEHFQVESDHIIHIGLTPNRSDATNHLGVARDLAAALRTNHGYAGSLRLPDVSAFAVDNPTLPIDVLVEDAARCPRYCGLSIRNVRVGESPAWLKNRLGAIGLRPINNVVDITNYVLHELGQPLHAFDAERIAGGRVRVKTLPEGTPFLCLDGAERALSAEDLMICDDASQGMCIAGVFGGAVSGVSAETRHVFLESAHFQAISVRRSSMRHNLRTDAAKIFEKGSDPNICLYALKRAALLIKELAGGEIASDIIDIYPQPLAPVEVYVRYARVSGLIGVPFSPDEVKAILAALEMPVLAEDAEGLRIAVPSNKVDVTREADVIEEILRIYGFDRVPAPGRMALAMTTAEQPSDYQMRYLAAGHLASAGFHEMMGLSFTQSAYFDKGMSGDPASFVHINNTANLQLDLMRPSMLVSGLEAIAYNLKRRNLDLRLFEFGHSYQKQAEGYTETPHLAIYMVGALTGENWHGPSPAATVFSIKAVVQQLFQRLGLGGYQERVLDDDAELAFGIEYHRGTQVLARFGKVKPALCKVMDVKASVFYADVRWAPVFAALRKASLRVSEPGRYPGTRRDLALVLDRAVRFADIERLARKAEKQILREVNLFDVFEDEAKLGAGKKSYAVSFSFEHPERTLNDKDVDQVMQRISQALGEQLGAVVRQ